MMQEMQIRNYSQRTIDIYVGWVGKLSQHFGCTPGQLTIAQVKSFLGHYVADKDASVSTINQIISAVKILFSDVLGRKWEPIKCKRPRKERRLPVVFSKEEIGAFLKGVKNKKHGALFATAYSSGLRLEEVQNLQFGDIDAHRMQIRVRQGKGKKDRMTLLSEKVLHKLRQYYRIYRPSSYLFEGRTRGKPISCRTIQKVFEENVKRSGISKPVTFHSLRHSFATHLMEQGINLKMLQQLLGHKSLRTTSGYLHISRFDVGKIGNPYDDLETN
jgi:integrase/recombinase XerD